MKVWKWYRNLTDKEFEESNDLELEDKYPLYAFTANEKHRDEFRLTRKKSRFIEVCTRMTHKEFVEFANSNQAKMLRKYKYPHYPKDKRYGKEIIVKVLSTGNEQDAVSSAMESMMDGDSRQANMSFPFNPFIFADEYIKALKVIQYTEFWKMYNHDLNASDTVRSYGEDFDYSYPSVIYDEFMGFIDLFGEYFENTDSNTE